MRDIHGRHAKPNTSLLQWIAEQEAINGPDFGSQVLVKAIEPKIQNWPAKNGTVVVGNRSMLGIEYFRKKLQPADSIIVYFNALSETLYSRYIKRENKPSLSEAEFQILLEQDKEMGLESVFDNADYVIQNNGGFDVARSKLRTIVDGWQPDNIP